MTKIALPGKIYLIPSNLNLEEILSINPPSFEYLKDGFIYIINLIYQIPSRNKDIPCNWGFVPINAQALQKCLRGYREYLDYLVTHKILDENPKFITGKRSRSFRFTPEYYRSMPVEVRVDNYKLLRNIEKRAAKKRDGIAKYPNLWQWFNKNLSIDVEAAKEFCQAHSHISEKSEREDLLNLQCKYEKIYAIKNHNFWFTVDLKGNRLHTNFTNLDSFLKPFITYKGQTLVAVDIKNSQPFLSIKILKDYYQSLYYTTTNPQSLPIILVNSFEDFMPQDVKEYIRLVVSGTLYEELVPKFQEKFGEEYFRKKHVYNCNKDRVVENAKTPRQQVKTSIFSIFFSSNKSNRPEKKLFKEIFPNVMVVFEESKKHHHNALACELQRIEASLVLDKACAEISLNKPGLPLFTIHDSVVTTKGNEKYVENVLKKYFLQEIGYTPQLDYDYWQEVNFKRAA